MGTGRLKLFSKGIAGAGGLARGLLWTGLFFLSSCLPQVPREHPAPPERLPPGEFAGPLSDDLDSASLQSALEKSLAYLEKSRPKGGPQHFSSALARRSLVLFRRIWQEGMGEAERQRRIRESFLFREISEERPRPILLTGYYEPVVEGSPQPGRKYPYPIYRRPDDLAEIGQPGSREKQIVRLERGRPVPYYTRREIDSGGALEKRGWELFWLKDPWERFVLHVQGSGQVRLPDGRIVRVGFAASNGRPYRSIGQYLMERGLLTQREISLHRIQDFLERHPERVEEILNANERYVFFRLLSGSDGPYGALGVALTPGRSIATDLALYPPGALAYLVSRQPVPDRNGRVVGWRAIRRFVLNQDTGAAMKGGGRVDLFMGSGREAGRAAGAMREEGRLYFLQAR